MSGVATQPGSDRERLQPNVDPGDSALPINTHRDTIIRALQEGQALVVAGETGSGKTTQLPRFALAAGFGRRAVIGHTQPRRIAARAVARRIAEETGLAVGDGVGCAVRFDDRTPRNALVRVMTDGILLNEVQRDPLLQRYEVLIIDEAHERSLNIDCLLGLLRRILDARDDLRVVITSATIDQSRFARFLGDAPVIEVSGRGYPVRIEYADQPVAQDDSRRLARQVCEGVDRLLAARLPDNARDILVFLPGEREIRDAERALARRGLGARGIELVPLYGRLADGAQQAVFEPGRQRRIVLATNVAETSLTVPRIGAVLDSGLARLNRYSPRTRVARLQLEPVAQASANQRAGRCGRIGPGLCLRLYSEADYAARPEFTDPEMLRTNLASVVLQMAALELGDIESFPFLDPPEASRIDDARRELFALRALDDNGRVTRLGRRMARLPLDPRLAAMLLAVRDEAAKPAVLVIVAGLSIQDPRQRPAEAAAAADTRHAAYADPHSDFISLLRLWCAAEEARKDGRRAFERWCEQEFLSPRRMREWREVVGQLARQGGFDETVVPVGLPDDTRTCQRVHQALLAGLVGQVGHLGEPGSYRGVNGRDFSVHPGSVLSRKRPRWVMALEIVDTHRPLARFVAPVAPGDIATAAQHLTRFTYDPPYWNASRGRVEARRTTEFGALVLASGRKVDYATVDRRAARETFVRAALVDERLGDEPPFLQHNRQVRDALTELAGQIRRPVEVGAEQLAALYLEALPEDVCDRRSLQQWLKQDRRRDARLRFSREQLQAEAATPDREATPTEAMVQGNRLALNYTFAPDKAHDGATLQVPAGLLAALTPADVEQSVPGFLRERIIARLRALPKAARKRLHPIAETASALVTSLRALPRSVLALDERLRALLRREYDLDVAADAWANLVEADYWHPRIRVTDTGGQTLAASRSLAALQAECPTPAPAATPARSVVSDRGEWPFAALPAHRTVDRGGAAVTVYPALERGPSGVQVTEFLEPDAAARAHRDAVIELLRRRFRDPLKLVRKTLLGAREILLQWAVMPDPGGAALADDIVTASLMSSGRPFDAVRSAADWSQLCEVLAPDIVPNAERLISLLPRILASLANCRRQIDAAPAHYQEAADDERAHVARLVYPGFLSATPVDRLDSLPRYLDAARLRLERIAANPSRDTEYLAAVQSLESRQAALTAPAGPRQRAAAQAFAWRVEELRVSLFAQSLGTREKVSLRRLEKAWDEILRMPD